MSGIEQIWKRKSQDLNTGLLRLKTRLAHCRMPLSSDGVRQVTVSGFRMRAWKEPERPHELFTLTGIRYFTT